MYRPEPYILVVQTEGATSDATLTASLVWLPDYATRDRINSTAKLGKADNAFTFEEGKVIGMALLGNDMQAEEHAPTLVPDAGV